MFTFALILLLAWSYLLLAHGRFWRMPLAKPAPEPESWPSVIAIVPARNEAATIGDTVRGILGQDYPGELSLIVVDDNSDDDTGDIAYHAASLTPNKDQLTVLTGQPLPEGWAGKVWAMHQGWEEAGKSAPDYIWFTDADIWHTPQALRGLVSRSQSEGRALTSAMVELHCQSFWEKLLVPAFVYFFQLLYPFAWVNNSKRKTAGAAGGSMLARNDILTKIKGPSAIKSALIDDCSLAKAIQDAGGSLRLDLTRDSRSLRGYPMASDAWNTIARTAYTQLGYNPIALLGSVLGLALLFLVPPLGVLGFLYEVFSVGVWQDTLYSASFARLIILLNASCALMFISFTPILKFYRLSPMWVFSIPFVTLFYLGATIDSARRYYAGSGGRWKGRSVERV